jgi:hypothetical protein
MQPASAQRQKAHRAWSLPEVAALVEGVSHFGRGQWADIKTLESASAPGGGTSGATSVAAVLRSRSAVDLKDKWRNLLRIASVPPAAPASSAAAPGAAAADGGYKRRDAAAELPAALLSRVRELAAAKASPGRAAAARRGSDAAADCADAAAAAPAPASAFAFSAAAAAAAAAAGAKGARRSKHHSPWSLEESTALVDGVAAAGGCRWTAIKKDSATSSAACAMARRSAMDLKDKWRNLVQLARLPLAASRRRAETPAPLLARVLELERRYGVARRRGRRQGARGGGGEEEGEEEEEEGAMEA